MTLRVAGILRTRDQAAAVSGAVAQLRRIGVRPIVAIDEGSTDGTIERLQAEEAAGDLWLVHGSGAPDADPHRMAALLASALDADWVLLTDPGERWAVAGGDIASSRALVGRDVVLARRYAVAEPADGSDEPAVEAWPLRIPGAPTSPAPRDGDASAGDGRRIDPRRYGLLVRPWVLTTLGRDRTGAVTVPDGCRVVVAHDVLVASLDDHGLPDGAGERVITASDLLRPLLPSIATPEGYLEAVSRLEPWLPALEVIAERAGIETSGPPALLSDGHYVVALLPPWHIVKLFGPWRSGPTSIVGETRAYRALASDPTLPVPRLVGTGSLGDGWSWIAVTRLDGTGAGAAGADASDAAWLELAAWTGRFVRRFHALPLQAEERAAGLERFRRMVMELRPGVADRLVAHGSLPQHLVAQVAAWTPTDAELLPADLDPVLLHGDLNDENVLVRRMGGRLVPSGVIDFGRSMVGHPGFELGPAWRWVCRGRPEAFAAFLDAAGLGAMRAPAARRMTLAWILHHPADSFLDLDIGAGVPDLDALAARMLPVGSG